MHGQYADGLAVHQVTSENISGRTLVVVLDQELYPHQTVYVLIDVGAVLDSSGNCFVGLVESDSNLTLVNLEAEAVGFSGGRD